MADRNFGRNIVALREINDLTQPELSQIIGISVTAISRWESGGIKPHQSTIDKICESFGVSERDLFGFSDGLYAKVHGLSSDIIEARPSETFAPLLGDIAAGGPREAIELSGDFIWVPPEVLERDPEAFVLRVRGGSMDQTPFMDGTFAAISPATPVRNGDIAAVKVNGDDATLKVFKKYDGVIYLEPRSHDPQYKRIIIDETDPDAPFVRVLGKAVCPLFPVRF